MNKIRIGLYGGSFDPPTKGHLSVANELLDNGVLDEIIFVPAYKSYHGKDYNATPQQRIEMLELLLDISRNNDKLSISDFEIKNEMTGGTYEYVSKFLESVSQRDDRDEYEFYFIMGMDNANVIEKFIEWKELIRLIPFVIVDRYGDDPIDYDWFMQYPHKHFSLSGNHMTTSSSKVREMLKEMTDYGLESEFFDMCSLNVFAYILNYELYEVENEDS